ncbi:MAG: type II toxin-antitoxin system Phd/YefM family antitoxin [Geminicoccaceae bacterium]
MRTVNVHAAKTHLSSLLDAVLRGEEVIIAKAGKPVARIIPIEPVKRRRKPGLLRGKAWAAPDAWEPDPELERLFYEGDPRFPSVLDEVTKDRSAVRGREGE